jgi:hypothetical protein
LRTIEVRSVAPHSCGTEWQQQINLPIGGGKSPPTHGSYREFIAITVPDRGAQQRKLAPSESDSCLHRFILLLESEAREVNARSGCNFHLTTIGENIPVHRKEPISISF